MSYEEILKMIIDKAGKISGNKLKFLDENIKFDLIKSTSFLLPSATMLERVYCLRIKKEKYNKCIICDNLVTNFINGHYSDYCSVYCSNASFEKKEKRKNTNLKKYGVKNPFQNEDIKNKIKLTNLQKYGVENPSYNNEIKTKISKKIKEAYKINGELILYKKKLTCLERYNVESYSQTADFIKKMNDTNLERYGNIWRSSTDEWKTSIKTHFIEKYGVENPFQNDDIKEKIKLVNLERYGVMNVSSSEEIKNKKIETYLENYGVSHFSQKHLSKEALDILDNKENLLNYCLYTPMPHKSLGICKSTLHKYLKKYKIKDEFIKKHVSLMEIQISNFISSLGFNIITNTREIISPYEIDIYVPEVRLAIECNGVYWHSELNGKNKNYHLNKTKICNNMGISLMHILDYEYINHTEIVLNEILYKLKRTYIKTCAEDLRICIIDKHDEELFLNSNHIQQYEKSTVCLGVKDENKLLAVMSFKQIKSRHKSEWILLRYACVGECVNGMNELFKAFIENYNPKSVIVYPDIRWHTDNRYELMGFTYLKDSPPNYYYTKDYKILESKTKYKKNKQKKILNFFDSNLTEWENMQANGFDRIWDCGNKVYVWRKDEH